MRDVVFLLIVVGFFAVAAAYVRACAAIAGEAVLPDVDADEPTDAAEAAA
ncbi:MAG: hypothetical protein ACRDYW_03665 [Acidimicrobiales bacterium]